MIYLIIFSFFAMTAFSPAQLPSGVNTVEKLATWASMVLKANNPNLTFIETTNQAELAVQVGPYEIVVNGDSTQRMIGRFSLDMNEDWFAKGDAWSHVKELSSTAIPAKFLP